MGITLTSVQNSRFSSAGTYPRPLLIVTSIVIVALESKWQITSSGLRTSKPDNCLPMSPALNSVEFEMVILAFSVSNSSTNCLKRTCFNLRMMLVTSSFTPGTEANSCSTPSILIAQMAKPSREERRMRRRALPTVVPKPVSKGRNSNFPYLESFSSITTLSGFWNANIAMKNRIMN